MRIGIDQISLCWFIAALRADASDGKALQIRLERQFLHEGMTKLFQVLGRQIVGFTTYQAYHVVVRAFWICDFKVQPVANGHLAYQSPLEHLIYIHMAVPPSRNYGQYQHPLWGESEPHGSKSL
jgi:hypothetical protein